MSRQRALELRVAVWGAITFGALLASHSVFRPVRDALVLDGNPDQIPWLFTATFVAMVVLAPVWNGGLDRLGRRRLVPYAFHAFALCALAFAVFVGLGVAPVTVGRVFYVWSSVFNMFVVSVFWSLLADLLGPDIARRLFGPIAAGGTIGAIVGPAVTRLLVDDLGVEGVLVISAGFLELAVIATAQVRAAGEQLPHEPAAPERPAGLLAGFAQLARSRYLLAIAGYVLCTATAATFLYFEQAHLAKAQLPDREARTELFASIDLWTNAIVFVLQTFVAARLLAWFGPGLVLALLPLAQVAGISLVVLAPSLAVLVAAQIASRALTHGLTRPARELLFTVVDPDEKYRGKNAIDTVGYRFGDLGSAWLYTALGTGSLAIVATTVPLAAGWLALAVGLGVVFRRRYSKTRPST